MPFGLPVGDELGPTADDGSSRLITEFSFPYFGATEDTIVVRSQSASKPITTVGSTLDFQQSGPVELGLTAWYMPAPHEYVHVYMCMSIIIRNGCRV